MLHSKLLFALTRHGHLCEGQDERGGVGLDDTGVVAGHVWDGIEEDDTSLDNVENESRKDVHEIKIILPRKVCHRWRGT